MDAKQRRLLLKAGFIKPNKKNEFYELLKKSHLKEEKFIESLSDSQLIYFVDEEYAEIERRGNLIPTGYPTPVNAFRFVYGSTTTSIEEMYFWILHHLKQDQGFSRVEKLYDIFSSSELSSMAGSIQYRIAQQQEKAFQYLKAIADMIKALFQIVREIRILKERLEYYEKSKLKGEEGANADIALKGIWIDLVEGGTKNPGSVYGMAQQVGFVTLPDIFFRTRIEDDDITKIGEAVKKWDVNEKVREVLARKLTQFYIWKKQTYNELTQRLRFQLKYLRQHYNSIKLYVSWVKPYLKTVKRLGMKEKHIESPEIISAFETSKIEIEILARKANPYGKFYPVILAHFDYRTMPSLSYQAEGYQRGPIHFGEARMTLRSYVWTEEQIENYKKYREMEDMELLKSIDETIAETLDALGDELRKYLEEAGEIFKKEEEHKEEIKKTKPLEGMGEPFIALFRGFIDIIKAFIPQREKKKEISEFELEKQREKALKDIKFSLYQTYKNYKKAHQHLSW